MARPLVLFVAPRNNLYGASRSMLDLVRGLPERGFDVHVALQTPGPLNALLDATGIPWTPIRTHRWIGKPRPGYRRIRNRLQDAQTTRRLADLVREQDVSLIHTNTLSSPLGGLVAQRTGVPHVWHMREAADTEPGSVFSDGIEAAREFIGDTADRVVCISDFLAESTRRYAPHEKIRRLYNGPLAIEGAKHLPIERTPIEPGSKIRLVMVGAVSERKGQKEAIQALRFLRRCGVDAHLTVAGDGGSAVLKRLQRLTIEEGVEAFVDWQGFVDPAPLYATSTVALACGPLEPLGRTVIESLAAGIPTIGIRSGGIPEVIDDGETGWLYEGSPESLADTIQQAMRTPAHTLRVMQREGHRRVYERFNMERYRDDAVAIYRELGIMP